jgi:hypothetical protein
MRRALGSLACLVALVGCSTNPPIVLTDSGVLGTDAPVVTMPDAPAATCPPATVPAPTMQVCAASTLDCLAAATTQAAQQACFMADPAGQACLSCVNQDVISSCTMAGTCADENGLLNCCVEEACPTGDAGCVDAATSMGGACAEAVNTLITCVNTDVMARRCGVNPAVCFMAPSGFLPDFRPARHIPFVVTRLWSGSFAD